MDQLIPLTYLPTSVSIREVGPRDGLQNEDVMLTTEQKVRFIDTLSNTGLRLIEVGAFVRPQNVPQMADTADVFERISKNPAVVYSAIVPNAVGAKRAIAAQVEAIQIFLSASESHNQSNVNMSVEQSLSQAADIAAIATEADCWFDGVISVVFGCPFEGDVSISRVLEVAGRLLDMGAAQITLGDTTGMAHPRLVQQVILAFQERFPRATLRLHPHSARGAGLANVLAALQVGVDRFDASAGGIGGCPFAPGAPGNICSEDMVHMLHEMGIDTGIDLPALMDAAHLLEELLGRPVPGQTIKAGICQHLPSDGCPRPFHSTELV
ncbi:MAG: hydroxymethylglutaryl-CoA lyase [Chloroflexi bacterium AL-W]|nr:hydroxymethylglutaryl-CoA lyase [Blastochloris sp.]NOK63577.1 hydroxymethylglutaryl-CoA lyase [Chloroflexi bacterium AL-N1]NOK70937.1 hydroxymethylglutaryl-CoA lyase [Chloroflexi bacterium AL-N10]NOK73210.1 hydroxymethylglutaryl-CoA lyase [Chloroflexi bacterium AL-N5]NOK80107.1 hydroxymethylglutaryl-CoA lyase [Chloroflexi bacterium AL-W]NOK88038.1 hydroxymethylglutaryl-CoA lyase [Chloroflexi bacterium AL-N15]